jgi:hypothetical protein
VNYSKGICWIDDCRIPFVDENGWIRNYTENSKTDNAYHGKNPSKRIGKKCNTEGRFPANLLVSDDMLNDGSKGTNSRYYDIDVWFDNLLKNYIY